MKHYTEHVIRMTTSLSSEIHVFLFCLYGDCFQKRALGGGGLKKRKKKYLKSNRLRD